MESISYKNIDLNKIEEIYKNNKKLTLTLGARHGKACIRLVNTYGKFLNYQTNKPGLFRRIANLLKSLALAINLIIFHARLWDILIFINNTKPNTTWKIKGNSYVFEFR